MFSQRPYDRPVLSTCRRRGLAVLAALLLPVAAHAGGPPPIPAAVASFGAAVEGDHLYVYGGHIGRTHQHSIENLSHAFYQLDLSLPAKGWQRVGDVQGLQGLPLVAYQGRVCRVGGLSARNHQGEDEDLVSVADVACFTPEEGWQDLPPLPAPRSSHDAVVQGDRLWVVGGWQLRGAGEEPVWHQTLEVLDLSAESPQWRSVPQPFQRRALAAAAGRGKIYALGGLGTDGTSRRVDVYDPAAESWSTAPELPAVDGLKGFGVSAFGVDDQIFLSGADGVVHALDTETGDWLRRMGRLEAPRFFHRLLPHGKRLLFVGGASSAGHLDSVEALPLSALRAGSLPEGEPSGATAERIASSWRWPGFRGHGDGVADSSKLPLRWSTEQDVAWRAGLPGYGQSAPVVWGDQVFVTSVQGERKETLILTAFDLTTGEIRWRRRFAASQEIESSEMVSRAAPTPVVDAERIYGFWESGDLVAMDHEGDDLWHRSLTLDYGAFRGNHGVASSPVITDDSVIVQVTHDGPSYYLAVDKASGETRWKTDRPDGPSWNTPALATGSAGTELISSAAGRVEALDAATGEPLWTRNGIERNNVPSVVVDSDLVFAASSTPGHSVALRRNGSGIGEPGELAWRTEGASSGFGSPLVVGDCVLLINKAGVVQCLDRAGGELRWRHRIAGAVWASPIAAGDLAFFFTKDGDTAVLRIAADGPEVIAENQIPTESTVYGVAAVEDGFLVRTGRELVRIGGGEIAVQTADASTR